MTTTTTTTVVSTIRAMRDQIADVQAFRSFRQEYAEELDNIGTRTPVQYFIAFCLKVKYDDVTVTDVRTGSRIDCDRRSVHGWAVPQYLQQYEARQRNRAVEAHSHNGW